jgi:hypothetical protein
VDETPVGLDLVGNDLQLKAFNGSTLDTVTLPATGLTTAQNGVNSTTPNTVELGGTLIKSTTIDQSNFGFVVKRNGLASESGLELNGLSGISKVGYATVAGDPELVLDKTNQEADLVGNIVTIGGNLTKLIVDNTVNTLNLDSGAGDTIVMDGQVVAQSSSGSRLELGYNLVASATPDASPGFFAGEVNVNGSTINLTSKPPLPQERYFSMVNGGISLTALDTVTTESTEIILKEKGLEFQHVAIEGTTANNVTGSVLGFNFLTNTYTPFSVNHSPTIFQYTAADLSVATGSRLFVPLGTVVWTVIDPTNCRTPFGGWTPDAVIPTASSSYGIFDQVNLELGDEIVMRLTGIYVATAGTTFTVFTELTDKVAEVVSSNTFNHGIPSQVPGNFTEFELEIRWLYAGSDVKCTETLKAYDGFSTFVEDRRINRGTNLHPGGAVPPSILYSLSFNTHDVYVDEISIKVNKTIQVF